MEAREAREAREEILTWQREMSVLVGSQTQSWPDVGRIITVLAAPGLQGSHSHWRWRTYRREEKRHNGKLPQPARSWNYRLPLKWSISSRNQKLAIWEMIETFIAQLMILIMRGKLISQQRTHLCTHPPARLAARGGFLLTDSAGRSSLRQEGPPPSSSHRRGHPDPAPWRWLTSSWSRDEERTPARRAWIINIVRSGRVNIPPPPPSPEPAQHSTEVSRIDVQTQHVLLLVESGSNHLGKLGIWILCQSLPAGLKHLTAHVQLHPGHLLDVSGL